MLQGTALFRARAVDNNDPLELSFQEFTHFLATIPSSPPSYESRHSGRIREFELPTQSINYLEETPKTVVTAYKHDLDHDTESLFWLMLYWAMTALPKGAGFEPISAASWADLNGTFTARGDLVLRVANNQPVCHSRLGPIAKLMGKLASVLSSVDRHWIDTRDPRSSHEFVTEAFQRLILSFLLNPENKDFMELEIVPAARQPVKGSSVPKQGHGVR